MNTISWYESPASWTAIASIIVEIGNRLLPIIPQDYAATVAGILGLITIIFHVTTVNKALGATH